MIPRVEARINLEALQHNFRIASGLNAYQHTLAVVKANAYGHGLIPVAEALYGQADAFGVTDVNEAQQLKEAGCETPILVMQGIIDRQDVEIIARQNFQLVIHQQEQLTLLEQELAQLDAFAPLTLWLKINTGMGRLGISPGAAAGLYKTLKQHQWVRQVILMTHMANANMPDSTLNAQQLQTFNSVIQGMDDKPITSIPNSAAMLGSLQTGCDWSRPGLMLYGSSPFAWQEDALRRDALDLQAVMTLQSKLIAVQHLKAGDNVGYCSQFICPQDMPVGIVSAGYADGYPSNTPNGTPVLVNNTRTSVVGRVSMDMLAIDLRPTPAAGVGDLVTLWGEELNIDEVADHTGIISYNLTCSVSPRVKRHYG